MDVTSQGVLVTVGFLIVAWSSIMYVTIDSTFAGSAKRSAWSEAATVPASETLRTRSVRDFRHSTFDAV